VLRQFEIRQVLLEPLSHGQEGAKQEVQEIVEFLKSPQKYTDLGGKIPKGAQVWNILIILTNKRKRINEVLNLEIITEI